MGEREALQLPHLEGNFPIFRRHHPIHLNPPQMPTNRRKHANILPVAKIMLSSVVLLVLGGGGLYYVNAKNEVHRYGQRRKELERELLAVATKDEVVLSRISKLCSYEALRKRQQIDREAFVKLVPVADTLVVRLQESVPVQGESQVRTVSNPQPGR